MKKTIGNKIDLKQLKIETIKNWQDEIKINKGGK